MRRRRRQERILGALTVLRPLEARDLPLLRRWNADDEIVRLMGKKFERAGDAVVWLEDLIRSPRRRGFAIETLDGLVIGDLEFEDISWNARTAELRVCIGDKAFRGRGYGTDAVRAATLHALLRWNLSSIYLRVQRDNYPAIRCYDRCGFRLKGVLPAGRRPGRPDLLLMSLSRPALDRRASPTVT